MAAKRISVRQEEDKRANQIYVERLKLEEELRVIERLGSKIRTKLRDLHTQCPHMRTKMIDYWEGGSCRIRIRCIDCNFEEPRGSILSIKKRGRIIEESDPQFSSG